MSNTASDKTISEEFAKELIGRLLWLAELSYHGLIAENDAAARRYEGGDSTGQLRMDFVDGCAIIDEIEPAICQILTAIHCEAGLSLLQRRADYCGLEKRRPPTKASKKEQQIERMASVAHQQAIMWQQQKTNAISLRKLLGIPLIDGYHYNVEDENG